ncbi:mechanosensitive ion channel family protein [Vulcaniibacterium tengchongense]|uniref:Small-conductance mechanosensitive channel n=1 Tax=Vulcaniibacterium tengchongense TaxID=1273429 RepID=A0A3N4VR33_9GAMM|nr:mechanosensitive ion channel family protein [Vulcaniibacterium tengchongense]RPE81681.1 small conductance mechanosensitive channel [Vulcaniibacterium tengchongense]
MDIEKLTKDFTLAENWTGLALEYGLRLLGALVALYVGMRLAKWVARLIARALGRAQVEPTAMQFLSRVGYVLLLVILALAVLQVFFGVQPTSMFAVLGAAGLAIGMALKDSLSNVASGVMLVTLKPFRVGDVVEIGGRSGTVESVSIFQTVLRGADNQTIVMPNSLITTAPIVNLTPDTRRRIELVIGIGYEDDIDVARGAALEVMRSDPRVLPDPAPDVLVYALADNAVNLGIRCHVGNADFFAAKCEITERIKKAFDRAGVSIPYPQRDVHMYHHVSRDGEPALPPGVRPQLGTGARD